MRSPSQKCAESGKARSEAGSYYSGLASHKTGYGAGVRLTYTADVDIIPCKERKGDRLYGIMKNKSENTQKFLCALPVAGLVLLILAMAALWAVALSYAVGVYIAWDSAMAFLTLFGLSFIGAGLCAISVRGLIVYMRKVWYDRWPEAPLASLFMRSDEDAGAVKAVETAETSAETGEKKSSSVIFKPKYLTLQNVGYALLVVAVIFVVASAAMGSLNADKWVEARSDYLTSHGWYAESEPIRPQFSPNEISSIEIVAPDRKIVVRYDARVTLITVSCYNLYPDEYGISTTIDPETSLEHLAVIRSQEPAHDDAIDKMLDLCFQPNRLEEQVIVTIPAAYRDNIKIVAENVIYAKE